MAPIAILGLTQGRSVCDNQGHVRDHLLTPPSGKVPYYFPCMTNVRSECRGTYSMCLNVHQQSFLRRQCPLLVLKGVVFLIEATDPHRYKR